MFNQKCKVKDNNVSLWLLKTVVDTSTIINLFSRNESRNSLNVAIGTDGELKSDLQSESVINLYFPRENDKYCK